MNLLPLQIILGFQVAAAVVIFIQLMKSDEADKPLGAENARRSKSSRAIRRSFQND